jgi:hypothetical protein
LVINQGACDAFLLVERAVTGHELEAIARRASHRRTAAIDLFGSGQRFSGRDDGRVRPVP